MREAAPAPPGPLRFDVERNQLRMRLAIFARAIVDAALPSVFTA